MFFFPVSDYYFSY